jgi:dTDP-glucose pyrophosphorylase
VINIVIPMAGEGSRFKQKGYITPKPFLDIDGLPMIARVMQNVAPREQHRFILIHREEHKEFLLENGIGVHDNVILVPLKEKTEGAACTVLTARKYLTPTDPLVIANSDQLVHWNDKSKEVRVHHSYLRDLVFVESNNIQDMINHARLNLLEATMATFEADHPKWSYARTEYDHFGVQLVKEVAEKKIISRHATCGIYYYGAARYFIESANKMIAANDRVNNEFYVCPAFNHFLANNVVRVGIYPVKKMIGLGTPEDYEAYIEDGLL